MTDAREFVRSTSAHLDDSELLKQPVSELLAVAPAAASALAPFGINTIFDLGCSRLFSDARVAAFRTDELGQAATHGTVPGDLLDDGVSFESPESLGSLPLQSLRSLDPAQATALGSALDVATLQDFAQWPPYVFARRLASGTFGGVTDRDLIQEEKLRPTFGEFPTERVYYTTLAMLQMNEVAADGMRPLDGGISLDPALAVRNGFTKPAVGALLTYSQSWHVQGITFGHLLHSLALSPGEATRIAIIDWARRTTAATTESITESEQLDSASSHARAISEVQNAVANEMQQGGSMSASHAESSSSSTQATIGTGLLTSLYASGDVSTASQSATTDTTASSSSWSLGNRSVAASMAQNINDRTEQHSTSVRNRRATAVREVSQSEHEQVSTRIVANYNHMHALTIQYYEIVQVYRVSTSLHRAERCLFIPVERLDFGPAKGPQYVERFRGALLRAALSRRVRELLLDEAAAVEISATSARIVVPSARPDLIRASSGVLRSAVAHAGIAAAAPVAAQPTGAAAAVAPVAGPAGVRSWNQIELATASRYINRPIVRAGSDSLFMPDDTELLAVTFDNIVVNKLRLDRVDPQATDTDLSVINGRIDLPAGVRMGELDSIHASRTEGSQGSGQMTLLCAHLGRRFTLPSIPIELGTAVTRVASFRTDQADRTRELLAHLQANNAYYTQGIVRSLDSATLVLLLSDFTWNGKPVIDQVEPKPVTVAGNFLVLRAPIDTDQPSGVREGGQELGWNRLLEQRGFSFGDQGDARVIPIATNGVFAEAVLGRSNSAEKLEYTRFWNWQDSPIPLSPTEIAPVGTGSRATPEDLRPGQLGQPVLNIVNPTSLPDPAGLGAVLTAVANGNMFRDMSGLAGTQTLAGQTAQGTLDAATAAGEIASTNMRAQMQKAVAMGQIAADLAKTAMGMPSSGGGNSTISAEAARVNHGESLDAAKPNPYTGSGGNGSGPSIEGGNGSSGGGDSTGVTGSRAMFASGSEQSPGTAAFNRGLWGPLGKPGAEMAQGAMKMIGDLAAEDAGGGGAGGGVTVSEVSPFSEKFYSTDMQSDAAHNVRLAAALQTVRGTLTPANKTRLDNVSIIVVKLTPSGTMDYAGVRELDMFFSGSLLKVALLYASLELVARVNELAPSITAGSANDFFAKVNQDFDPKIANAVPAITPGPWRKVQFARALAATANASGTFQVTMSVNHDRDLRKIFSIQNQNDGATECMHRLGFSYVNGALAAAGFLGLVTERGIWMATDYVKDDPPGAGNWRSFHIPVSTNGTSSAAMTTLTMASLMNKIHRRELVDPASSQTMQDIFGLGKGWAWLKQLPDPNALSFTAEGAKVGHSDSPSANVPSVLSEALFLKRKSDSAPFAAVWQNVPDSLGFAPIYKVIDEVVKNWP